MLAGLRDLTAPLAAAATAALILFAGPADWLRGPSLDALLPLRAWIFDRPPAHESPVAVIAVDEETYLRPPFRGTPKALWTPEIGHVLDAVLDGGATVIGFDLILPTTVEARIPGHDRSLMLALRRGGKEGRMVLARVQHQTRPLGPFPGLAIAVGRGRNIRLANVFTDADGVVRRVPTWFRVQSARGPEFEPSFALEIASRHLDSPPVRSEDDHTRLGVVPVRGAREAQGVQLNFHAGSSVFPTYSLADLHACAKAGHADFFRNAFAGKVVLFGAVLDAEDRLLTSKRFITGSERDRWSERCIHPVMDELFRQDVRREQVPGVMVQATAVDNLVRNTGLARLGAPEEAALVLVLAAACAWAWAFQRIPLGWMAVGFVVSAVAWTAVAVSALDHGVILPGLTLAAALVAAAILAVTHRYLVTDRERRAIRRHFSLYLPPTVVDRLLATGATPALGGERRVVTILLSDIEGYTAISERMSPEQIVDLVNRYFKVATDIVERHGGIVDKFMGDGLLAVFGAPVVDPDHAAGAVAAAKQLLHVTAADPEIVDPDGAPLRTRIGVATGTVLIGDVGSGTRMNYTVIGDTVNLASRLEAENKTRGTSILVTGDTARAVGLDRFEFVDRVTVRGRNAEVLAYTPRQLSNGDPAMTAARGSMQERAL